MRGRLIFPFLADIAVLDSKGTSTDPDASGSLESGYDDVFMEPRRIAPTTTEFGAPRGTNARKEKTISRLPCQPEVDNMEFLQQMGSGPSPAGRIDLIFHFRDLEQRGLLDQEGTASIFRNSRLIAIRHLRTKKVIREFEEPRSLFAREIRPVSWGLAGGHRNLLIIRFENRDQAVAV